MNLVFRQAIVVFGLLTLITGVVYPLAITAIAQVCFAKQAAGSLLRSGEKIAGSELIGQAFDQSGYLWGRPSATAPSPYNASASSGSNLGPTNPALHDVVVERLKKLRESAPDPTSPVPIDLVTASASGLDPHISPAAARWQVPRIAKARHLDEAAIQTIIDQFTQGRTLGLLGEVRVNVLRVNLALDALGPQSSLH
jgi:K+-transporting ATPase ATPase C chain